MSSPIPILSPGPEAVLNPWYDNRGYTFTLRSLSQMQMPSNLRLRTLNYADQLVRSGSVSYSPIWDLANNVNGWSAFETLLRVCKQSDPQYGCLFWASDANHLNNGIIGAGDGATTIFQLRSEFSISGHTVYQNIYYPIQAWSSPLVVAGLSLTTTVVVTVDGVLQTLGVNYTVNNTTGKITFMVAPDLGAIIRATCYYVHPIFLLDTQPEVSWMADQASIKDLRIMEVPQ